MSSAKETVKYTRTRSTDIERTEPARNSRESERRSAEGRVAHLVAVIESIRHVHELIVREKDIRRLAQGVCDMLVRRRGYHNAWVALLDESASMCVGAEAGLDGELFQVAERIERGEGLPCCSWAMTQEELTAISDPIFTCKDCPISGKYRDRGAMSIRLAHEGHVYGLLTVSLPRDYVFDEEEQTLFRTVAADIACAVRRIEMEREQKEMESALRRARDELEVRVKERTLQLERLSTKLLDVQEDERKRIAADLHDGIGQSLSAVKFLVENALEQVKGKLDPPELEQLNRLVPMLRHASDEVRTIVMNLRPSVLDDLGILATIRWFCRRFRSIYRQFDIVEEIRVREGAVSPRLKTIVFRILQEAMNNAAKHSQADRIRVSLTKTNAVLDLSIEDNGRGFNPDGLNTGTPGWEKGFGITGMKERTELSGGVFRIDSKAGEGTTVKASWHLH